MAKVLLLVKQIGYNDICWLHKSLKEKCCLFLLSVIWEKINKTKYYKKSQYSSEYWN